MIQLIVYGLLIAALVGGAVAIRNGIENKGIAKQQAIDKPIIEAAQKAAKDAIAANDSLRGDLAKLGAERQACSDQVTKLGTDSAAKMASQAKALAATQTAVLTLAADADAFRAKALDQPKQGATCDQTLANVVSPLRDLAARRLRDHAPGSSGHGASGGAAAAKDSGAGTLRIKP